MQNKHAAPSERTHNYEIFLIAGLSSLISPPALSSIRPREGRGKGFFHKFQICDSSVSVHGGLSSTTSFFSPNKATGRN